MVVGVGSEIIAALGWSWVVSVRLWLVVGSSGKIMAGRGWSWVFVDGRTIWWSWMVARFSNTHYFQMKTKVLPDFRICISVPLSEKQRFVKKRG